jgi:hypothetical protein
LAPPSRTTLHNGNRLVGCRAVMGRKRQRNERHISPGRWDGSTTGRSCVEGPSQRGVSPQSIPRVESVEGARNLMGGRPDRDRSAQIGGEKVRCRTWVPVEECKTTRGNNQTAQRPGAATDGNTPRPIIKGRRWSRKARRTTTVRGTIL